MASFLKRSPWVMHYDGSSCNGCDIEVLACLTPVYDAERLGVINTGNPKHADILLLTGSVNEQNREVIQNIYDQMPSPKVVLALGICATSGGIFAECYNVMGGADRVVPVDVYVPGCPVRPEAIIDAVITGVGVLEEKYKKLQAIAGRWPHLRVIEAEITDAEEIYNLQKLAYRSEAEIYNDFELAPLRQTLDELRDDFKTHTFYKAVVDGHIIGSVRGSLADGTCAITRLIVHPGYAGMGLGDKLMDGIEWHWGPVKRYEVFTGHKSQRYLHFYRKRGYEQFKCEYVNDKRDRIYLEKIIKA